MKSQSMRIAALAVISLCIAGIGGVCVASAQDSTQQPPPQRAQQDGLTIQVIPLRHSSADDVARIIHQSLSGKPINITPDERTNSVIVRTTPDVMKQVVDLIETIDVAAERGEAASSSEILVRVFDVRDLAGRINARDLIPMLMIGRTDRIAMQGDHAMLVAGPAPTIARVEHALETLRDQMGEAAAPLQRRVRVVWLVSSLDNDEETVGRAVPRDVEPVARELQRIGVENLRLAAQLIFEVRDGSKFGSNSQAHLDEDYGVMVTGTMGLDPAGNSVVELSINAESQGFIEIPSGAVVPGPPGSRGSMMRSTRQSNVGTTITTQPGRWIVLGVTPLGKRDSIFAVQVMDAAVVEE